MNYQGTKWKRKRSKILRMDGYRDRVAAMYGKTMEANLVHHIFPAAEYPEYAYEDWNLISVSQETHNKLEKMKQEHPITKIFPSLPGVTDTTTSLCSTVLSAWKRVPTLSATTFRVG